VLNANYIWLAEGRDDARLRRPLHARGAVRRRFLEGTGVTTLDFAKAMIDEGYHPDDHVFPAGGAWRDADRADRDTVTIGQSRHTPPDAHLVAGLVEEMCDYVNDNWVSKTAAHLSAYVMWRLNWIHPFADGNGRTSRALSYLVLCIRSGHILPGTKTIPEQISQNKTPYYEALEAADEALRQGVVDVSKLEALLSSALATQLADYHRTATGDS
jgi:Fic family protein